MTNIRLSLLRVAIGLAGACFLLPAAPQSTEPFAYKSAPVDTSVRRFLELNPEFTCEPSSLTAASTCLSRKSTYAGFDTKEIRAAFLEGKLSNIEISVVEGSDEVTAKHAFNVIEQALTEKYGPSKPVVDKSNGLTRDIRSWKRDGRSIQLSYTTNGTSHLTGVMIGRDDHWKRSVDSRRKKAAKDI